MVGTPVYSTALYCTVLVIVYRAKTARRSTTLMCFQLADERLYRCNDCNEMAPSLYGTFPFHTASFPTNSCTDNAATLAQRPLSATSDLSIQLKRTSLCVPHRTGSMPRVSARTLLTQFKILSPKGPNGKRIVQIRSFSRTYTMHSSHGLIANSKAIFEGLNKPWYHK